MKEIILASNNQGKIREFKQLTKDKFKLYTQSDLNISEVPETGLSFVENALLKARNASKQGGFPAMADDSGIVVDYLNGAPGIYSARYGGEHGNSQKNNAKLLKALEGVPNQQRTARYWCAMAYVTDADDPCPVITQASWDGVIATEVKPGNGFGYDPIFYIPSHQCYASELLPETKNSLSHRAKALNALIKKLQLLYHFQKSRIII